MAADWTLVARASFLEHCKLPVVKPYNGQTHKLLDL